LAFGLTRVLISGRTRVVGAEAAFFETALAALGGPFFVIDGLFLFVIALGGPSSPVLMAILASVLPINCAVVAISPSGFAIACFLCLAKWSLPSSANNDFPALHE